MQPNQMAAMTGMPTGKKKTHRGRRGRGKGPKDHHTEAKSHMQNALASGDPQSSRMHLFKALSSLKKAATPENTGAMENDATPEC